MQLYFPDGLQQVSLLVREVYIIASLQLIWCCIFGCLRHIWEFKKFCKFLILFDLLHIKTSFPSIPCLWISSYLVHYNSLFERYLFRCLIMRWKKLSLTFCISLSLELDSILKMGTREKRWVCCLFCPLKILI